MPPETAQTDRQGCDTATVKQLNAAFNQTTWAEWWPTGEGCILRWGIQANRLAWLRQRGRHKALIQPVGQAVLAEWVIQRDLDGQPRAAGLAES